MFGNRPTRDECLAAALELALSDRPNLARLCAEEAADQTDDPAEAARILASYPDPNAHRES